MSFNRKKMALLFMSSPIHFDQLIFIACITVAGLLSIYLFEMNQSPDQKKNTDNSMIGESFCHVHSKQLYNNTAHP